MTARKPTDGTTLTRHTHSQEQVEKKFNILNESINFLVPHIRKIVEESYREEMGDPKERAAKDCEEWQELKKMPAPDFSQEEIDEEEKKFCQTVLDEMKKSRDLTVEEMIKENEEIDKGLIEIDSRMKASHIWQMIVYAGTRIFKRSGPQNIDVQAFLAGLDLARCLADTISKKYYSEIKMILALYMPQIFKKSFIGRVEEKYMEMFFQESSEQIILREVSYEVFQIWVNS